MCIHFYSIGSYRYYRSEPSGFRITCLTARHFSGRFLRQNPSLWASFMLEGRSTVYIGGDSGYDAHFSEIGKRLPHIDLAILENGQYNEDWRYIHTMPEQLPAEIHELDAAKVLPVHNTNFHSPVTHGTSRSTASNRQQQRTATCMLYMVSSAAL